MTLLSLGSVEATASALAGPKAATLARLHRAGLPVPDGFCLAADAYRAQLAAAGVEAAARRVCGAGEGEAARLALEVRLGLLRTPLRAALADALARAYRDLPEGPNPLVAVRSSALCEGGPAASFAGQLETLLGVAGPADLLTAVSACWASLWVPRTVRYMRSIGVDPAATAVAVLVQPLVQARVAGGALSATPDGRMVLTAAWGLGPAVAQGEVVPDRYVLERDGPVLERLEPGEKPRRLYAAPGGGLQWQAVAPTLHSSACLDGTEALTLARLVLRAEAALGGPAEIEWALDDRGFHLLQARPLPLEPHRDARAPANGSLSLQGQPAGVGWAVGPARVVRAESELARVQPGDVLVTRVPGPALAGVLSRVAGVVAELGGSTSHLAALARERGIPAVLGAPGATRRIPDGALVVVDGTRGTVYLEPNRSNRWPS